MRRIFALFLSVFFFSTLAFAGIGDSASMEGLSEQQKAQILQVIADKKAEKTTPNLSTPEKVDEWVGVGTQIAELIPVFAEKTGIAADKVLNSTAGQILLAIVLVKYFWAKLCGILFLTVGFYVWWKMFQKVFLEKSITYTPHPNGILNWFGVRQKTIARYSINEAKENYDETVWFWIFAIAGLLNIIFGVTGIMHGLFMSLHEMDLRARFLLGLHAIRTSGFFMTETLDCFIPRNDRNQGIPTEGQRTKNTLKFQSIFKIIVTTGQDISSFVTDADELCRYDRDYY